MSTHTATIVWTRADDAPFKDNKYSRGHEWRFDGGTVVPASSAPSVVRPPLSRLDAVDPEEALVAALSSCHMLFFLSYAAKRGFVVDRYEDDAIGEMGKNASGAVAMRTVHLRPQVTWAGETPTPEQVRELHDQAHASCYIANSVHAEIVITPR